MAGELVISAQKISKSYGYGQKKTRVLNNLNMFVPKGHIYGLLGSSGCGKTTLLSCILGLLPHENGDIHVFGEKVHNNHKDFSYRIGYMPQEMGLTLELTVEETIKYFGMLYGLDSETVYYKQKFLTDLLALPPMHRKIKKCSGGEKRRVSFAVVLIHDPDLLILDEPTVGLDPVLRQSIWDYLTEISSKQHKTIVITTHYIEESRQANTVALMRNGEIMAEESPDSLLSMFQCETLEDVFLSLSIKQNETHHVLKQESFVEKRKKQTELLENAAVLTQKLKDARKVRGSFDKGRISALFYKNIRQGLRDIPQYIFLLIIPLMQQFFLFNSIGNDLSDLHIGIVNEESTWSNCSNLLQTERPTWIVNNTCVLNQLSCYFLGYMDPKVIIKEFYDHVDPAIDHVNTGKLYATIHISRNFSTALENRIQMNTDVSDYDLTSSEISIWFAGDFQVKQLLQLEIYETYKKFVNDLAYKCGENPQAYMAPVHFFPPIYGKERPSFGSMAHPGFLLALLFLVAVVQTANVILNDRLEGIWNRNIVAGVSSGEILLSHTVTQTAFGLIPLFDVIVFAFFVFGLQIKGSLFLTTLVFFFSYICGLFFGLLISLVSTDYVMATFMSTGLFLPTLLISGIFWPVEGMPALLQTATYYLPFAYPVAALRDILIRGWSIAHMEVFMGIFTSIAWSVVSFVVSLFLLEAKIC